MSRRHADRTCVGKEPNTSNGEKEDKDSKLQTTNHQHAKEIQTTVELECILCEVVMYRLSLALRLSTVADLKNRSMHARVVWCFLRPVLNLPLAHRLRYR